MSRSNEKPELPMSEHYRKGTQGINTGTYANLLGRQRLEEQMRAAQAQSEANAYHRPAEPVVPKRPLTRGEFEERVAGFLMFAAWIAVSYFGITLLTFAWYWPVGAGLIVGLALYGLLLGPLRVVLRAFIWMLMFVLITGGLVASGWLVYKVVTAIQNPTPPADYRR